jgi:hypothetical protein
MQSHFSEYTGNSGSLNSQQRRQKNFQLYAIFSAIFPAIHAMIIISADNCLDTGSYLSPRICQERSWFSSKHFSLQLCDKNLQRVIVSDTRVDFIYFQGPVMVLLLINLIFFLVTLMKIIKMKRGAKVFKRNDSVIYRGRSVTQDKER